MPTRLQMYFNKKMIEIRYIDKLLDRARGKVAKAQASKGKLKGKKDALESEVEELKTRDTDTEEERDRKASIREARESEIKDLEDTIDDIEDRIEDIEDKIKDLNEKKEAYLERLNELVFETEHAEEIFASTEGDFNLMWAKVERPRRVLDAALRKL